MRESEVFIMKITEALEMYKESGNKVGRTTFNNWVNTGEYGLKGKKVKGTWYLNDKSVSEALKLYEAVRTGTYRKCEE